MNPLDVVQILVIGTVSFLKLMNFMAASMAHMERVPSPLSEDTLESSIPVKALARDCCYDKRKKRGNFAEIRDIPA